MLKTKDMLYGLRLDGAKQGDWYKDYLGELIEVHVEKDSETGYVQYVVEDTEHNRKLLVKENSDEDLLLGFMRDGFLTIDYKDGSVEYIK